MPESIPLLIRRGIQTSRRVWGASSDLALGKQHISIKAIMNKTGISSTSVVSYHLEKLVGAGYMTRGPEYLGGTWRVVIPLGTM